MMALFCGIYCVWRKRVQRKGLPSPRCFLYRSQVDRTTWLYDYKGRSKYPTQSTSPRRHRALLNYDSSPAQERTPSTPTGSSSPQNSEKYSLYLPQFRSLFSLTALLILFLSISYSSIYRCVSQTATENTEKACHSPFVRYFVPLHFTPRVLPIVS